MAQYLPVLLVSVSAVSAVNPAPDDSSLDTQAIGQVDYLSHDWQEEDIAKSWRNMTRRKDSIQNGARLENASWRTWWKQRNKLPTVSPETLNWLKDSDVTWLYGPLHTAADWTPPPRHTPSPERESSGSSPTSVASSTLSPLSLHPDDARLRSNSPRSNSPWALKPILKHRSISELLSISFQSSASSDPIDLGDDQGYFPGSTAAIRTRGAPEMNGSDEARKRPKLTHAKSDTNVHRRNPFRGDSPPSPLAPESQPLGPLSPARSSITQSRDSSCGDTSNGQKRHISFNTFVEQCIAIEKPKKSRDGYFGVEDEEEDNFHMQDDMDEDGDYEDESNDEDESEDDVLEMRPGAHSRIYNRRTPSLSGTSGVKGSGYAGFDIPGAGSEREHVTIAPIAPTILKTSASPSPAGSFYHGDYGSLWEEEEVEELPYASRRHASANSGNDRTDVVNLVYVPPQGSVYAERMAAANATTMTVSRGLGFPINEPPRAAAQLRAASFDDADLLTGTRAVRDDDDDDDLDSQPFESGFDLFTGSDMGGVEDSPYRMGPKPRSGRSPGQARSASMSDLASRTASVMAPEQMEDLRTVRSRSSSSSISEEGTIVPPSLSIPSSPRTGAALRMPQEAAEGSPVLVSSVAALPLPSPSPSPSPSLRASPSISPTLSPNPSASIPIPTHAHVHQLPSPTPSSISTSTTSTGTASSNTSCGSGHSMDRDSKDPPRGRSRSRSIGGSALDGSVSPRSGSHSRLNRRASIDGGSNGLGGLGVAAYGLSASPSWRGMSLSPEDKEGGAAGRAVMIQSSSRQRRGGRSDKGGRRESSVSPLGNARETTDVNITLTPTPPISIQAHNTSEGSVTLMGRAVSSAKGYLGSLWGTQESTDT